MSDLFDIEPLTGTVMPDDVGGPLGGLPAGTGVLQTRGSYSTAVRVEKKRDLNDVSRRLMDEANFMGEAAFYGWGAGKDRIEGPSQELALAAARVWGNCAIEVGPVQETADAWIITSYFIDLETGFTMGRPFRQSKRWTVAGKLDAERKDDVRFQIGATKSARNVALKSIPGWLIDRALDQAKAGVRAKLEKYVAAKGLPAAQDLALSILARGGVKEADVLRKFGVASKAALDVEKLVMIQGDIKAIQGGEARPEEIYPPAETTANGGGVAGLEQKLKKSEGSGSTEGSASGAENPDAPTRAALSDAHVAELLATCGNAPVIQEAALAEALNPSTGPDDPPPATLAHVIGEPGETEGALHERARKLLRALKREVQK